MSENDQPSKEAEELAAFEERFQEELEGVLELLDTTKGWEARPELSHNRPDEPFTTYHGPLPIDIEALGFEDLNSEQVSIARAIIFQTFGLDPNDLEASKVRQYTSQTDETAKSPGEVSISVYRSTRAEGEFLQKMTFSDGQVSWMFGPDQDI